MDCIFTQLIILHSILNWIFSWGVGHGGTDFFSQPSSLFWPLNRNGLSVCDQIFRGLDLMLTIFGMKNYSGSKESLRDFDTSLSLLTPYPNNMASPLKTSSPRNHPVLPIVLLPPPFRLLWFCSKISKELAAVQNATVKNAGYKLNVLGSNNFERSLNKFLLQDFSGPILY